MKLTPEEKRRRRIERVHDNLRTLMIGTIFNAYPNGIAVLFQKIVRLRARDEHGYCTCITCGTRKYYTEMQGGHFIPRGNKATILDHRNVHAQCVRCNEYLNGNSAAYLQAMLAKYGQEVVDELQAAKLPRNHTWDKWKLAEMKIDMLDEIARLEKQCLTT